MNMKIWLLTIGYFLLMFLVGLNPTFGEIFIKLSVISLFLAVTFLVFTFLATENKGSKVRTILRYIIVVALAGTLYYFFDYEIKHHFIGLKIKLLGETVEEHIEETVTVMIEEQLEEQAIEKGLIDKPGN